MSSPMVIGGDCLKVLRDMESESVHAIVTDPPYGLSQVDSVKLTTALTAWVNGDRERVPGGKGFMGKEWDAFVPPPAVWDECLRVLKPGGHMLVFAGSRTVDLMGLSIRLAGFEIRDTLQWLYGSGFPKSMDVSKSLDKTAPREGMFEAFATHFWEKWQTSGMRRAEFIPHFPHYKNGESVMAQLSNWKLGKNVPSVQDFNILRGLIGLGDGWDSLIQRVEAERLDRKVGKAGSNRVFSPTISVDFAGTPATDAAREWEGWGTALKPAAEPIILARKPLESTVARNVLAHGVGGLNIDGCRVAYQSDADRAQTMVPQPTFGVKGNDEGTYNYRAGEGRNGERFDPGAGRFPANVLLSHNPDCTDEQCDLWCPVAELDAQSDNASRFFPSFRYQAKAPKSERPKVDEVAHPTVKPVALMRWLVRLITPPGGTVLDPFAGSGTTLQAAQQEGFESIGIERELDYVKLIEARLEMDNAA